jgi:undecaprenyl-diphosphatase
MSLLHITILAIIQGLAELLPISSSAHVVVAERLLGLDPSTPPMTLLLVMLHTGTMCAVIVYFWRSWRTNYFQSSAAFGGFARRVIIASALTALVGGSLMLLIEHQMRGTRPNAQIEDLFDHLELIAPALAAVGVLICWAGIAGGRGRAAQSARSDSALLVESPSSMGSDLSLRQASVVGAVQGLSVPFRGFSRSGATISAGLLLGVNRARAEAFSFALAVVLTPPAIAREALRLVHAQRLSGQADLAAVAGRCLLGALFAFIAGLVALRWLSRWLEAGRWYLFGIYCLVAAAAVAILHHVGY